MTDDSQLQSQLTWVDIEQFGHRVDSLRPGTTFVTVLADEGGTGWEECTGTVEYHSPSCTTVELNRGSRGHRTTWAHEAKVIPINLQQAGQVEVEMIESPTSVLPIVVDDLIEEEEEDEKESMATASKTPPVTANTIKALQARYKFQNGRLVDATESGNDKVANMAMSAMEKIVEEAVNLGIDPEILTAVEPSGLRAVPTETAGEEEQEEVTETATVQPVAKSKPTKAQKDAEAVAKRAASVAAEKKNQPAKEKKVKAEPKLQECLDGCGEMVKGNFKMGHDAKLKSLILKVERGDEPIDSIPEIASDLITFKKGEVVTEKDAKGQVKSKTQTYICTKAPVRFPGRTDVQLTVRD